MKAPVHFRSDEDATAIDPETGQPMSEAVVALDPGPCVVCGRSAEEHGQGVLDNVRVENGVMKGDATCDKCLAEQGDERLLDLLEE